MQKALYILSELNDRDFEWILKNGKLQAIAAGQVLIREGRPVDAIYMVLEGTLSVTVRALGDREIARLSAGEVVGEMSFVDDRAPSATVSVLSDAQVWSIPRTQLLRKLSQDPSFAAHFYQAIAVWLSHRLRGTMSRWGYAYGYGKDNGIPDFDSESSLPSSLESDLDPGVSDLARIRLDWLLSQMKNRQSGDLLIP